jgi:hypothetical protein
LDQKVREGRSEEVTFKPKSSEEIGTGKEVFPERWVLSTCKSHLKYLGGQSGVRHEKSGDEMGQKVEVLCITLRTLGFILSCARKPLVGGGC